MKDGSYEVEETRFGFTWGPAVIERVCVTPSGGVALYITGKESTGVGLEIWISPKGRSIRAFRGAFGKELK